VLIPVLPAAPLLGLGLGMEIRGIKRAPNWPRTEGFQEIVAVMRDAPTMPNWISRISGASRQPRDISDAESPPTLDLALESSGPGTDVYYHAARDAGAEAPVLSRLEFVRWMEVAVTRPLVGQQLADLPGDPHHELELFDVPEEVAKQFADNEWLFRVSQDDPRNRAALSDLLMSSVVALTGHIEGRNVYLPGDRKRVLRHVWHFISDGGGIVPLVLSNQLAVQCNDAILGRMGPRQLALIELRPNLLFQQEICGVLNLLESFNPTPVPSYREGPGGSLGISRVMAETIARVDLSPIQVRLGQFSQYEFRRMLASIHCPKNFDEAGYGFKADVRTFVLEALAEYVVDEVQTQPGGLILLPPRLVRTASEAEAYVAEVLIAMNGTDVTLTPAGPDGGVDVRSVEAVAQVKMEAKPIGRPTIQQTYGIAVAEGRRPLVFSISGFTSEAVEWAELAHVACWAFARDGSLEPITEAARHLHDHGF
jgi:hypothetical protein